jgi:hypothetical protein
MRWPGHVARKGEKRNAYRILVGKPEGKRPLGRPRRMWVGNIKIDLRQIGWDGMDWINPVQYRDQFITAFTRALHWFLSWARSTHSIPAHPVFSRSILILFSYPI